MSLTEREQRVLAELEQDFQSSHRKLAVGPREVPPSRQVHRRWRCVAAFVAGLVLLLTGVIVNQIAIGVVGFVVMVAATMSAVTDVRVWMWNGDPRGGAHRWVPGRITAFRVRRPRGPR